VIDLRIGVGLPLLFTPDFPVDEDSTDSRSHCLLDESWICRE
jgi:hypothetical protein